MKLLIKIRYWFLKRKWCKYVKPPEDASDEWKQTYRKFKKKGLPTDLYNKDLGHHFPGLVNVLSAKMKNK